MNISKCIIVFTLALAIAGLSPTVYAQAQTGSSSLQPKASADKTSEWQSIHKDESMAHFGESVQVGTMTVVLQKASFSHYFRTGEFQSIPADGIFIEEQVQVSNIGKDPVPVASSMFQLVSADGAVYHPDIQAVQLIRDNFRGVTLEPGEVYTGVVLFDAPKKLYSEYLNHGSLYLRFQSGGKSSDMVMKQRIYEGDAAQLNPYITVSVSDQSSIQQAGSTKIAAIRFTAANHSDHTVQIKDSMMRLITPDGIIYPDTILETEFVKIGCQSLPADKPAICSAKTIEPKAIWPAIPSGKSSEDLRFFDLPNAVQDGGLNSDLLQVQDGYGWVTFTLGHAEANAGKG